MTRKEFDLLIKDANDKAERYYRMFKACEYDAKQDFKSYGYTDEEILKEFITLTYWYGYMDRREIDEITNDVGIPEIIDTIDGVYKAVYCNGPLSCSVAGGMDIQVTYKTGEKKTIHLPPGWTLKKI